MRGETEACRRGVLEHGQLDIGAHRLALYAGAAGWPPAAESTAGAVAVVLLHHDRPAPLRDLDQYLQLLGPLLAAGRVLIAITAHQPDHGPHLHRYPQQCSLRGVHPPILWCDDLRAADLRLLLKASLQLAAVDRPGLQ